MKIGDKVRIANLTKGGQKNYYTGTIGHEGVITEISSVGFYRLNPYCKGSAWPESCLELIEEPKTLKMDYTIPGTKIPFDLLKDKMYTTTNTIQDSDFSAFNDYCKRFNTSFGITIIDGTPYIQIDEADYKGSNYLLVRLSDIQEVKTDIVGYNLKDPKNEKVVLAAFNGNPRGSNCFIAAGYIGYYYDGKAKLLGIQDWFEPVYAPVLPKERIIELGNPVRKFSIFKEKIVVTDGSGSSHSFTKEHLRLLETAFNNTKELNNFTISAKVIHIGCDAGTSLTLEDLGTIKNIQNEL